MQPRASIYGSTRRRTKPPHSPKSRSDGKAHAEGNVTQSINASVHGRVSDVDEISKFWHHARVDHANGEAQAGVRDEKVVD